VTGFERASDGMRRWRSATFEALSHPHYRILWAGTTLAFLAFMMSWVAQSVVAFDISGKNGSVGVVSLGMGVSQLLIGPFGGAVADRISKRGMLLLGQALAGLNFIVVGVLILTGVITIPLLVASTFMLGVVFAFIAPARQAWVGELLPARVVPNGIALTQVAMTGTRIIGPLLAGGLVAWSLVGPGGTYLFMGGLFALVVATLWKLPPSEARPKQSGGPGVFRDLYLGFQHVAERPRLALLAVSFILVVITGYSYQVVLPGFLENELGRDAGDLGIMMAVSAVTGLIATIGLAGAANSRLAWPLMIGGAVMLGASLLVLGMAPNFAVVLVAMLLTGAGTGAFQMLNNALVMQESAPQFYGRVFSLTMMAWGFNGLSGLPFGLLADGIGERETTLIMGAGVLVVCALTTLVYSAIRARGAPVTPMPDVLTEAVASE
jgi:MFS family permease